MFQIDLFQRTHKNALHIISSRCSEDVSCTSGPQERSHGVHDRRLPVPHRVSLHLPGWLPAAGLQETLMSGHRLLDRHRGQVQRWVRLSGAEVGLTVRCRGGSDCQVQRWVRLSGEQVCQTIRWRGVSNYQVKRCVKLSGSEVGQTIRFRVGSNYQIQRWVKLSGSEVGQTIRFRGGSYCQVQRWVKVLGAEVGQTIRFRGVSNHQVKTLVKLTGVELSLLINDPVWPSRLPALRPDTEVS